MLTESSYMSLLKILRHYCCAAGCCMPHHAAEGRAILRHFNTVGLPQLPHHPATASLIHLDKNMPGMHVRQQRVN